MSCQIVSHLQSMSYHRHTELESWFVLLQGNAAASAVLTDLGVDSPAGLLLLDGADVTAIQGCLPKVKARQFMQEFYPGSTGSIRQELDPPRFGAGTATVVVVLEQLQAESRVLQGLLEQFDLQKATHQHDPRTVQQAVAVLRPACWTSADELYHSCLLLLLRHPELFRSRVTI